MEAQGKLSALLKQAKSGGQDAREKIIRDYTPFVMRVVARVTGRSISLHDDEASVGLVALNEAIDRYDEAKGGFLSFAERLIRHRLIDYLRREKRESSFPADDLLFNEEEILPQEIVETAWDKFRDGSAALERRAEIVQYQKELAAYGLTFSDLVNSCPRHRTARKRAIQAACVMVEDEHLLAYFATRKMIPIKELSERVKVSRKTLERHRKYLVAVALVLAGTYQYLKEYIRPQ